MNNPSFIMVKVMALAALLVLAGCSDQQPVSQGPALKETGLGYVRSIDFYHQIVVHETDGGFIKAIHLCDPPAEFWVGEHANIKFYWNNGCDRSFGAERK